MALPCMGGVPNFAQVFPTQHVWLRARCRSIKVQLLGYALDEAPQHIWVSVVGSEFKVQQRLIWLSCRLRARLVQ